MNRRLTKNIYTCQMKRYSTSYITRKLHIRTIRYHHTTIRMVTTQTLTTPNGGQEAEQQNLSRECKITQDFLTKLRIGFPGGISGRELTCQYGRRETQVPSLGQEDALEEGMATRPVFLSGELHGQRSLAGYSPEGCKESNMTEATQCTHPKAAKYTFLCAHGIFSRTDHILEHKANLSVLKKTETM